MPGYPISSQNKKFPSYFSSNPTSSSSVGGGRSPEIHHELLQSLWRYSVAEAWALKITPPAGWRLTACYKSLGTSYVQLPTIKIIGIISSYLILKHVLNLESKSFYSELSSCVGGQLLPKMFSLQVFPDAEDLFSLTIWELSFQPQSHAPTSPQDSCPVKSGFENAI